ncbi:MAG: mitofilin family membrane protein [Rhizobiaceae bacterium]
MVKSPKIRHSKQRSEPVTIDLSADDVKRDDSKSGSPGKGEKAAASKASGSEKAQTTESAGASSVASASQAENQDKTAQTDKAAATSKASASQTVGSSFGRGPGPSEQSKPSDPPKNSGTTAKPAEPPSRRGGIGALAAGLVGGIVALIAAGALYLGGYLPGPSTPPPPASDNAALEQMETELSAMREEIAALKSAPAPGDTGDLGASLADTNARVDNMAVMIEDVRGELGRLSDAVAAGGGGDGAALATLQTRLAEIEQTVAALPEGGSGAEALSAELATVGEQVTSLRTALDTLDQNTQQKFSALDETLASLGARLDEQADEPSVALAIAASALKAAIDRGQPFAAELETFARLAPDAPEVAALRELAATGVPTAAAIATETDAAARRIIVAARPDNADASLFERLWASAESLIAVRPIGSVEGDDVPAVVARMEAAIKNGDYAGAIAEYEMLPDAARAAGADFIAGVKARQTTDELVAKVLADALRA